MENTDKPDRATFRCLMALRPFGDFEGLSTDEAYDYIFGAFDHEKSPISIAKDASAAIVENVQFYRDVVTFLDTLKSEQPLKLTQHGNLPVSLCKKLVGMGVVGEFSEWLSKGKAWREQDCYQIHLVNVLCRVAGLTRKMHGRLSLTKRANEHIREKESLCLYSHLFFTYARRFNWGYEDGYPVAGSIQGGFGFSIYLVSKYGDKQAQARLYADKFAAAFPFVINSFPVRGLQNAEEEFYRCYRLRTFERFLCRFGLVDATASGTREDQGLLIAKSSLFDQLLHLRLHPSPGGSPTGSREATERFAHVYQFKITLREVRPLVWRRIQVAETCTFWGLHVAIQDAMGWSDSHLHEFVIRNPDGRGEAHIGIPDEDFPSIRVVLPDWRQRISDWFSGKTRTARYEYDFGDGWEHDIRLEKIIPREKSTAYPVCLDGRMACPPEDVGGPGGYERFLRILADSSHPEHENMLEWVGGEFDPKCFDPNDVVFDDPRKRLESPWHPW